MEPFLLATDVFLLLFWVRLWSPPEGEFYFNPFLSAPTRLTDRVLDFLQPVLPLPGRLRTLLVLAFLLAFRAIAVERLSGPQPWSMTVGTCFVFVARTPGLPGALVFSLLDFLFFVARLWSLYLLVRLLTPVPRRDRGSEAFHVATRPFSSLPWWVCVVALAAVHAALLRALMGASVVALHVPQGLAAPALPAANAALPVQVLFHGWLTALSIADGLLVARGCLVAFILGSLASLLLQNPTLNVVCNEGISVLLGRFGKRMPVGLFDFTPVLYYFGVSIAHYLVCTGVLWLMTMVQV